jgi:aryl-alcohol dehydrogenase-like predicted oxidoreductase
MGCLYLAIHHNIKGKDQVKYQAIAQTGIQVSVLGLGTVKLGRDQGVKYPNAFHIPDDQQARKLIHLARDLGINLIDTAPAYGVSEERLGKLLKGQRQDWVIATKTGEEFDQGASYFDFSRQHTIDSVERSLRRLQTDYLDVVMVHSDGNDVEILQQTPVMETLQQLKQEGKIRAVGMSTKTVEGGLLAAAQADVVMVTYNLKENDDQKVLDYCQQNNKGAFVKKALASGHVQGPDDVKKSFAFVLEHPGVSSIIVGTISPDHLKNNVACALECFS